MNQYESLKRRNVKFPMTKKMFDYYITLGFNCYVLKYHSRMDGSIFVIPGIFYSNGNLLDCLSYDFMDREDIRKILFGWELGYFQNKYEKRCKEIFKRRMYSDSPNSING